MNKKALLNIDYTHNFVTEDGKLSCSVPGQALEDDIVDSIEAGDDISFAIDAYNKSFDIVMHGKGVASFNQPGHEVVLEYIKNVLGGQVI